MKGKDKERETIKQRILDEDRKSLKRQRQKEKE